VQAPSYRERLTAEGAVQLVAVAVRVTGGCMLVGLMQAGVMARLVASDERRRGRRYVRLPGSRILRGTKLGYF